MVSVRRPLIDHNGRTATACHTPCSAGLNESVDQKCITQPQVIEHDRRLASFLLRLQSPPALSILATHILWLAFIGFCLPCQTSSDDHSTSKKKKIRHHFFSRFPIEPTTGLTSSHLFRPLSLPFSDPTGTHASACASISHTQFPPINLLYLSSPCWPFLLTRRIQTTPNQGPGPRPS